MTTLPRRSHQKRPPPSTLEHLLIFQAVYELGNSSFADVWSKITASAFFAQEYCPALSSKDACQKIYNTVMNEYGSDLARGEVPKAQEHFDIVQRYFGMRKHELRSSIAEEEQRFKTLHQEMEEIRAGLWDERIAAEQRESSLNPSNTSTGATRRGRPTKAEKERRDRAAAVKAAQEEVSSSIAGSDPPMPHSDPVLVMGDVEMEDDVPHELHSVMDADAESDGDHYEPPQPGPSRQPSPPPELSVEHSKDEDQQPNRGEKRNRLQKSASTEPERERSEPPQAPSPSPTPAVQVKKEDVKESRAPKRARTEDNSPSLTPSATPAPEVDAAARKRFRSSMSQILSQIDLDSAAGFFRVPVQPHEAPSYHALIRQPLDLKTIGKRVREGKITSTVEFRRDVLLMLSNAVMFNKPHTDVAKDAQHLFEVVESLVHVFEASDTFSSS